MEMKKKQESQARILYVILAALLVTVMVVSVITAVNKRNKKPQAPVDTADSVTTKAPVTKYYPVETIPEEDERPPVTQAPVTRPPETQPPVTTEKPKDDKPTANRAYVVPTKGEVMKDFSIDMPVYSLTMNDYRAHKGIDISAEYGTAVCSFTDGVVEKTFVDPMMGVTVTIDHGDGLKTNYCNLQQTLPDGIVAGAEVKAGDMIGAIGETTLVELAEASHLHFEIIENDKYIDPTEYLPVLKPAEE